MKFSAGLIVLLLLAVHDPALAVPGDLNRDGKVDLIDFFLFADNFGLEGPPEVDTVFDTLTVEVRNVVTIFDTLQVTVFDTVILGREEIRFSPPPPLGEIAQSLEITWAFKERDFWFSGEAVIGHISNSSSASLSRLTLRLTVRNADNLVIFTRNLSVPNLLANDTRPFHLRILSSSEEILDNLKLENLQLDVTWDAEIEKVNNVSLALDTDGVVFADPFTIAGEIQNTTDLTVSEFSIFFYGLDVNGNPHYSEVFSESTFGIPPGGTAPFFEEGRCCKEDTPRDEIAQLFYYIRWEWAGSGVTEETPLIQLF